MLQQPRRVRLPQSERSHPYYPQQSRQMDATCPPVERPNSTGGDVLCSKNLPYTSKCWNLMQSQSTRQRDHKYPHPAVAS